MGPHQLLRRLLMLSLAASFVNGQQTDGSASPTPSSSEDSSIASSPSSTTTDLAMQYWDLANELISSYYPSTTIENIATLTWPSTVVINGHTYNPQAVSDAIATTTPTSMLTSTQNAQLSETTTSPEPTATAGATDDDQKPHKDQPFGDKKLGIILGCVIGFVTLVLLAVVFWCLKRRKDDTGSFFMRRRTPSIASSDFRSWLPSSRPDTYGTTSYVTAGDADPNVWPKHPQVSVRPQMTEPRMSQHPAFAAVRQHGSSRSTSEDNPFYTPAERFDAQLGHDPDLERGRYDPHPVELDDNGQDRRRSSSEMRATEDRPPTPFSPMAMMGFGASRAGPSSHVDRKDFGDNPAQGQSGRANPFSSPEDEEDDIVSPILPSKSPERRHSPMVHYPSVSEVSEFDFSGDGSRGVRNMSSSETDGGDGWHPIRERTDGRYELA